MTSTTVALRCRLCGQETPAAPVHVCEECFGPLEVVYDTERLTAMQPTRLFIDAHGTAEWRARGFFGVTGNPEAANDPALMLLMLQLGHAHPFNANEKLPESVGLDINRPLTCAQTAEFPAYVQQHPLGGMPYGMAPLSGAELGVLAAWVTQGATPPPPAPPLPEAATAQVARWIAGVRPSRQFKPALDERLRRRTARIRSN